MKTTEQVAELIMNGEGEKSLVEITETVAEYTELLTHTGTMPMSYTRAAAEALAHLKQAIAALQKAKTIADEVIGEQLG